MTIGTVRATRRSQASQTWPSEPESGRGRRHGTSSSESFDRWFRYPAGFASDYAEMLLRRIGLDHGTVVDPFTGSGVTGTAARRKGLAFVGLEAHPLVAELARLKLSSPVEVASVSADADEVVAEVRALPLPTEQEAEGMASGETELVRRSFDARTLYLLLALRAAVRTRECTVTGQYLKWALLGTLRDVARVKVGWPYQRPGLTRRPRHADPVTRFRTRVAWMAEDLRVVEWDQTPPFLVLCGDARDQRTWQLQGRRGQACVASPPYLNNFDYADATRLELYFWGEVTSWSQMVSTVRKDMLTATTQQSSTPGKQVACARLEGIGPVGDTIMDLAEALQVERRARRRGKEYDQVAPAYFVGMIDVLKNLAGALDRDSTCVWLVGDSAPYGMYVDTPALIGALAETVGFEVLDDVTLRHRGKRWQATGHTVALSERLLVFRRR